MLYKIINNESANYMKDILLPRLSEVPSSLLRLRQDIDTRPSVGDLIFPRNRTQLPERLFPYVGAKLWNKLYPPILGINQH